ncbi:MAG TPA: hypothetical protein VGH07_03025, partial [Chthoniobacterales bacterium]
LSPGRNITAGGTSDSLLGSTPDKSCRPIEPAPSFLQPLDHPIPMIAAADTAQMATVLRNQTSTGVRIVELEGPRGYSANDLAAGFITAPGQPVRTESVPRSTWETLFRSQGIKNPTLRVPMNRRFQ